MSASKQVKDNLCKDGVMLIFVSAILQHAAVSCRRTVIIDSKLDSMVQRSKRRHFVFFKVSLLNLDVI